MAHLSLNVSFNQLIIAKIVASYRTLAHNLLCLLNGRLFIWNPLLFLPTIYFALFLPSSLRRVILNLTHASCVAGRMGK